MNPYTAGGGQLVLSKLTGSGGPIDFWVYSDKRLVDRLNVMIPAPEPWMKNITITFHEPFQFNQVLVRGMQALAPWDGQRFTFLNPVYATPEPGGLMLAITGMLVAGVFLCRRGDRFVTGDIVQHKVAGQKFIVLRSVLIPFGGYLVRGCVLGKYYRRRFRHFELEKV